jgi:hypothetical protein
MILTLLPPLPATSPLPLVPVLTQGTQVFITTLSELWLHYLNTRLKLMANNHKTLLLFGYHLGVSSCLVFLICRLHKYKWNMFTRILFVIKNHLISDRWLKI